ncbi:hypothetical protein PHYBLDRAFT_169498 [Phycomyces blakesleeanus NRRL 1555(-)]|uniref:Uncharacterized protein n=1 Tax=Phycomyces blakesleeanus (strain ATCC 8743b / DSM 1359 / FGSC 10004 / NBRC 33097 / NRRL 1555) TaxID=763407 RepID=A0A163DMK1_PHYB8|nr:hypothetical protein PHYBLDRAFT_169498 [Phycomyces blakesleeanus NRRL 1555(-)]OAD72360.1 hypothetical protein PHYBLDRAFT_169498 [Phycomyces blakesleeanus NRRL 1555(-)]|eukprot:XP_018290400.1 hypothetical protein PHYBLDRAFT_169498 [Phycomyces blakesleeanus NRRL 1555(-)]
MLLCIATYIGVTSGASISIFITCILMKLKAFQAYYSNVHFTMVINGSKLKKPTKYVHLYSINAKYVIYVSGHFDYKIHQALDYDMDLLGLFGLFKQDHLTLELEENKGVWFKTYSSQAGECLGALLWQSILAISTITAKILRGEESQFTLKGVTNLNVFIIHITPRQNIASVKG